MPLSSLLRQLLGISIDLYHLKPRQTPNHIVKFVMMMKKYTMSISSNALKKGRMKSRALFIKRKTEIATSMSKKSANMQPLDKIKMIIMNMKNVQVSCPIRKRWKMLKKSYSM